MSLAGKTTGGLAALGGLFLALPLLGIDPFFLDVLTVGFLFAAFAGSWDLVGGVAGQISLGHALFFGTATYTCAILTSLFGLSFAAAAVGGLVAAAAAGAAAGACAARLKGPFVALLTLSLGELAHEAALGQTLFSPRGGYSWGGEGGIPVVVPWPEASPWGAYYAALLFLVASTWGMLRIARSRQGLLWTAVAGSELSARASGVDVPRQKRAAFITGAVFAGAAGVGFAAHVGRATAADFSVELSFQAATCAAVGGRGTVAGAVLVSLALQGLLQGTGLSAAARVLLYAAILLVTLRFFPGGVAKALGERARTSKMVAGREETR